MKCMPEADASAQLFAQAINRKTKGKNGQIRIQSITQNNVAR